MRLPFVIGLGCVLVCQEVRAERLAAGEAIDWRKFTGLGVFPVWEHHLQMDMPASKHDVAGLPILGAPVPPTRAPTLSLRWPESLPGIVQGPPTPGAQRVQHDLDTVLSVPRGAGAAKKKRQAEDTRVGKEVKPAGESDPFATDHIKKRPFNDRHHLFDHFKAHESDETKPADESDPFATDHVKKGLFNDRHHLFDHFKAHESDETKPAEEGDPFAADHVKKGLFNDRHHLFDHFKAHESDETKPAEESDPFATNHMMKRLFNDRHHLFDHFQAHESDETKIPAVDKDGLDYSILLGKVAHIHGG